MKKKDWLIIKDNKVFFREEVFEFTPYDFLFWNWKIKGKNPVIIEGDCVVEVKHLFFSNKPILKRKRVKIYNPIIEL